MNFPGRWSSLNPFFQVFFLNKMEQDIIVISVNGSLNPFFQVFFLNSGYG